MLVPVSRHVSIVHNEKIYVFGGETEDYIWSVFTGSDIIQEYDPVKDMRNLNIAGLRYYTPDIHKSAFVLPQFMHDVSIMYNCSQLIV